MCGRALDSSGRGLYLLFPLIAELLRPRPRLARKKAVTASVVTAGAVYVLFQAVSVFWREAVVLREGAYVPMYINQLPAFLGTYANGMLGAMLFVLIARHLRRSGALSAACTLLSVLSLVYIASMVKDCAALQTAQAQLWQVSERFRLTAAFTVFILSTALAAGWYRFLFSNRLMRFLAGISYNLYIWHQWLAVQIKYVWRIPRWEGEIPPNQLGDRAWMYAYALIITVAAFAAAVLATYLIEKPFSRLILGKARPQNRAARTGV